MTHICVFEDEGVHHLHPLVTTRAVYDLRLAHQTILGHLCQMWETATPLLHAREEVAAVTAHEHPALTVNPRPGDGPIWFVNGRYVPLLGDDLMARVHERGSSARVYVQGNTVAAAWLPNPGAVDLATGPVSIETFSDLPMEEISGVRFIDRLWDLVDLLPMMLDTGHAPYFSSRPNCLRPNTLRAAGVTTNATGRIYTGKNVSIGPGAILNARHGPIVLEDDAAVMEGAVVRGPVYLGSHARIKCGARVEGSAIGPYSKVGGEVCSSIVHSFSNKAHEGFLGNSYVGRWCNLGADTNVSNLRNDYAAVSLYNEHLDTWEETGCQFLGLFMGDHSKSGINTMFDTGSVIGVYCNIFGAGYQDRYVPSFSWGSSGEFVPYRIEKALQVAEAVMNRRSRSLTDAEHALLRRIHAHRHSAEHRTGDPEMNGSQGVSVRGE